MAKRKQEKDSIGSETSSLKKQKLHLNVNQAKPNLSKDLVNAAYKGNAKLIESLLIAKADVNHERRGDYTELSIYAYKSTKDTVNHLLTEKANAHYIGFAGSTALILAAWTEYKDILTILVDHNVRTDYTTKNSHKLCIISEKDNSEDVIDELADQDPSGIIIDDVEIVSRHSVEHGCTALMFAVALGHKELENLLNLSLNIDNIFLSSQYEKISDGMLPDLFIGRYRALWNKFGYDDTADYHIEKIRNTVNNTEIKEQLISIIEESAKQIDI